MTAADCVSLEMSTIFAAVPNVVASPDGCQTRQLYGTTATAYGRVALMSKDRHPEIEFEDHPRCPKRAWLKRAGKTRCNLIAFELARQHGDRAAIKIDATGAEAWFCPSQLLKKTGQRAFGYPMPDKELDGLRLATLNG
ncbi:MAG: hypothetical protein IPN53_22960 [Comamonadaceae bacterium]|nr:hypothetical protein [Comamonadaceae bacterium]